MKTSDHDFPDDCDCLVCRTNPIDEECARSHDNDWELVQYEGGDGPYVTLTDESGECAVCGCPHTESTQFDCKRYQWVRGNRIAERHHYPPV